MAGIYLHIPFCQQKCAYCNFYSVVPEKEHADLLNDYADALISEIILRKNECFEPVETIYFGGGTPSLLSIEMLVKIFETLRKSFTFAENPEITLEGNPESLSKEYLQNLRKHTPVNRLSIGVQSFFEKDLQYLNRRHSPQQALESIENARHAGFERLSIDLIYGIPTLTNEHWSKNLETFFSLAISHLSAYALTVEKDTILARQIQKNKLQAPDEEQIEQQYFMLREQLKNHAFEAYEISNFCKNGHYSKHNANYWNGSKYYGFGASAHSFSSNIRSWNISDVNKYIASLKSHLLPCESEFLTEEMQYNEYVMTAIRTHWGILQNLIQTSFNPRIWQHFQTQIQTFPSEWLTVENDKITTTEHGALFADAIAERLFV